MRHAGTDQRTTADLTVDVDQERMPVLVREPVVVKVGIAVLAVWSQIATIDLGEVVGVELEQPPDHRLVTLERWDQPNVHANNLPATAGWNEHQPGHRTPA